MKHSIVLQRGAFKYDVFYPVITNCFQKAGRINSFWQTVGVSPIDELVLMRHIPTELSVTDWPSTEPSIKRCTCVNKRKNSGSRWTLNKNITRTQTAWVSWSQLETRWEPAADRGLWALSDPRLSNPAKMRKKYCWINIAVYPVSISSLTHNQHQPFRE